MLYRGATPDHTIGRELVDMPPAANPGLFMDVTWTNVGGSSPILKAHNPNLNPDPNPNLG